MSGMYLLKRLFWLIPTLFFIIILTFVLKQGLPGDPILSLIHTEESSEILHPYVLHHRYNQMAKQWGADLPLFYLSVTPGFWKEQYEISDLRERRARKKWWSSYDPNEVDRYFDWIKAQLTPDAAPLDYQFYLALLFSGPERTRVFLDEAEHSAGEAALERIEPVLASKARASGVWPRILWLGTDNQFHHYLRRVVSLDWGSSLVDGQPVMKKIGEALSWTFPMSLIVIFLAVYISKVLAFYVLMKPNAGRSTMVTGGVLFIYALPLFWLATLAIVFLTNDYYGRFLNIFPAIGVFHASPEMSFLEKLGSLARLMLLPLLCMVVHSLAFFYLQWKDNAEDQSVRPYVVTARAKGLKMRTVLDRHIFPNSAYTIFGLLGFYLPAMISGSVIIEVLFNIPGMGRLMYLSVMSNDWNVVLAVVMLSAAISFVGFLLADVLIKYFNPKTRIYA